MKKDITILKLKVSQWEEYRDLRLEALRKDSSAFGSSYQEERNRKENEWKEKLNARGVLLAYVNGLAVGIAQYRFREGEKLQHVADISSVYVKDDFRGRGIAKALMIEALKQICKNPKVIKISLNVHSQQVAARSLYEKLGFKIIGIFEKEVKIKNKYFDSIVMERFIK